MTLLTVVQARTGSTRLPGKVLLKLGGHTILEHVIHRLTMCQEDLGQIIVATGSHGRDNPISEIANHCGLDCFRGAEHDVLHRFHTAATELQADHVLRVTADCPLLDPELVDLIVTEQAGDITRTAGAPKGIGEEELITSEALQRLWREVKLPGLREHVTAAAMPPSYTITYLPVDDYLFDHQHHRYVLDTPEDWDRLRLLYSATDNLFDMSSREIIELAETVQLV